MSRRRKNFFKITKKGDTFTATTFRLGKEHIVFQEKVKNLRQYNSALMTTNFDGKYDLYLPVRNEDNVIHHNMKWLPILKNIESYQYLNGIFLLRYSSNAYTFISNTGTLAYFKKRTGDNKMFQSKLPEFHAKSVYLKYTPSDEEWIYHADGNDFYFRNSYCKPIPSNTFLGTAEELPCNNKCFKITNQKGQFIHEGYCYQDENPKYYPNITPFSDTDYPNILPKSDGFYGYWMKDQNGNILGFSIYKAKIPRCSYSIILKKPAKELYFIRRLKGYSDTIDLWKITYVDESCDVCLHIGNKKLFSLYETSQNDLIFVKDSDFL